MKSAARIAAIAWVIASVYYFYQYMLRSAPAVMMPELSAAFGIGTAGVASLAGLFYYGYSPFSLVAGVAMDRLGAKRAMPIGAALVGVGALLFASGGAEAAAVGRFLQGAGGAFALIGAAYIATQSFPASRAATLIGATQMFGMAGGSAGQFLVGPIIGAGTPWSAFWAAMGVAGLAIGLLLLVLLPGRPAIGERDGRPAIEAAARPDARSRAGLDDPRREGWAIAALRALAAVFRNPQSLLCGAIAGLMFLPTTIFDMTWGVSYLQEAHGFDYPTAVMRSATVPLGWIIGCPLLGAVSDRLGRRKPVIVGGAVALLGCLAWILYGPPGALPPYVLGIAMGVASGAAMLPYTVIKEANEPGLAGTATGVVNFLNFTFSALLGPVFGASLLGAGAGGEIGLAQYQTAFRPMLYGVALAIVLSLILRETGRAARRGASPAPAPA
ncbi:MAG TPA: MFS transporter [Gammaproteobacteria bacterium]|nr:MFS transporter [Gammaproteobacteria bacterium]